jgi:hypothetical protein
MSSFETLSEVHERVEMARPLQFRIRSALAAIVALSVLFAVMHHVGPMWSVVIAWSLLLIAAHVVGNAWGKHSKDAHRRAPQPFDQLQSANRLREVMLAEQPERLLKNTRPSWLVMALTLVGAVVGGTLGTTTLVAMYFGTVGNEAIALGGTSAAIIGGFVGFLIATFATIMSRAMLEASRPSQSR